MMDHCDCFDETMFDVYDESESVNAGELGCITRVVQELVQEQEQEMRTIASL